MHFPIEIETHDRHLGFAMAGEGNTLKAGAVVDLPGGAKLRYRGTLIRRAVGIPEVLQFLLEASITVELGLLAAWLYDKVKDTEKVSINRRVLTEITEEGIRQVLEEEIRSSDEQAR